MRNGIRRVDVTDDMLRQMHAEELSVLEMSKRTNYARVSIVRRLKGLGLPIRGGSQANAIRMSRMTTEERAMLADAAHRATRGRTASLAERVLRARTVAALAKMSRIEAVFFDAFTAVGLSPVPQYQVGIWNIDLALPERMLAVEIDPGHWHTTPKKIPVDAAKDAELRAAGWRVVRLAGHPVRLSNPLLRDVAARMAQDVLGHYAAALDEST